MDCQNVYNTEVSEEAQDSTGVRQPSAPTEQEIRDHEQTHLPFRDWCKHCVMGRAKNDPHYKKKDVVPTGVPRIILDYMYVTEKKPPGLRPAVILGEGLPVLVAVDSESKGIVAFVVPTTGENEYAISRIVKDISQVFGYRKKMILKGDQEPALQVVLERAARLVGDQVILEQSPVGESQSNGEIENAV